MSRNREEVKGSSNEKIEDFRQLKELSLDCENVHLVGGLLRQIVSFDQTLSPLW